MGRGLRPRGEVLEREGGGVETILRSPDGRDFVSKCAFFLPPQMAKIDPPTSEITPPELPLGEDWQAKTEPLPTSSGLCSG